MPNVSLMAIYSVVHFKTEAGL